MPIEESTKEKVFASISQLANLQYLSRSALALLDVGMDLANRGETDLANAVIDGVSAGLQLEQFQQYPKCPFCGKRHK